jgi:hypothetical protein
MLSNGISSRDFFSNNLKKKKNNSFTPQRTLQEDLSLGYKNEEELIPILNNFFNDNFRNTKDLYGNEYYNYDFEGVNGTRIELKSRRNKYNDYPTTLMPVHKCVCEKLCPNIFVFNFSDGLYYLEWNADKFKTYETKMILYKRFGRMDYNLHYMIPIEELTLLV